MSAAPTEPVCLLTMLDVSGVYTGPSNTGPGGNHNKLPNTKMFFTKPAIFRVFCLKYLS